RLGAIDDEQPADLGIKPPLDQVVDERLHDGSVLGCSVVTAHPRAIHGNLATMETDLSLGSAPAVADPSPATVMSRADELLRVLAKHLLDGSDPGRQTEALEGAVHILPSHLQAGHERER